MVQGQERWEQRLIVCPNESLEELEEETRGSHDLEIEVGTKYRSKWTKGSLGSHKHRSGLLLICFLI